jgi:hypothetical protein
MSSEPRYFNASLYAFQLVVRYFCGAGFIPFRLPDLRVLRWSSLIYATKPVSTHEQRMPEPQRFFNRVRCFPLSQDATV